MDALSLLLDRVPGLGRFRGDIKGGLLSAAGAIPLAMGYGMFGFVVLGNDYFLDGALAGLLTAAVVGIVCVALGDKSANVYAPRVITTFFIGILLYGLVHSESPILKSGGLGLILAVLFSIILLGGLFQAPFASSGATGALLSAVRVRDGIICSPDVRREIPMLKTPSGPAPVT